MYGDGEDGQIIHFCDERRETEKFNKIVLNKVVKFVVEREGVT